MMTFLAFTKNNKFFFLAELFTEKDILDFSGCWLQTDTGGMLRKMFATVAESQLYSSFSVIAESESLVEGTYHLPESDWMSHSALIDDQTLLFSLIITVESPKGLVISFSRAPPMNTLRLYLTEMAFRAYV